MSNIAFIQRRLAPHGGNEMFALRFLEELSKLGDRITILSHSIDPSLLNHFEYKPIPVLKPLSVLKLLSFAFFARRVAKKNNYDLIFSNERTLHHDIYFAGEGCHEKWLEQRFRQLSWLKVLLIRINPLHWAILYLEKKCLGNPRLKGVIAFSQRVKKELITAHHLPEEKVKVVYHGVPAAKKLAGTDRQTLRMELGIQDQELVILFVGSGFERKGLRSLIEGLSHFDCPQYRLLVVGKGDKTKYVKLARKLKLQDKVQFLGIQSEVAHFYSLADIFVLPTIYEPFGLVVLEAMTYGLPVVVSRNAGVAELISHSKNGLIVNDPFNPSEIGHCLNQLKDPDFRKSLAQEGNKLAQAQTLDKNIRQTMQAVNEFFD